MTATSVLFGIDCACYGRGVDRWSRTASANSIGWKMGKEHGQLCRGGKGGEVMRRERDGEESGMKKRLSGLNGSSLLVRFLTLDVRLEYRVFRRENSGRMDSHLQNIDKAVVSRRICDFKFRLLEREMKLGTETETMAKTAQVNSDSVFQRTLDLKGRQDQGALLDIVPTMCGACVM